MMAFWSFIKGVVPKVFLVLVVIAFIYFVFVRPWILHMGATKGEVKMKMPGDGLVKDPVTTYTHAITIKAPREIVWAYLIQVGWKRAGWYNWDFINRMADKEYFYENNKSADRIIPELQCLKQGDKIFLVPQIGMNVEQLKQNEIMMLTGNENGRYLVVWTYMLKKIDKDTTRLYVRWSSRLGEGVMVKLMDVLVTEPGGVGIQQSQMLRGIKQRAERDYMKQKAAADK